VHLFLQDMELINILYLQDIDLGIGREAFEDLCSDSSVSSVEQKSLKVNQVWSTVHSLYYVQYYESGNAMLVIKLV